MEPGYRLRLYLLTALILTGFGTLLSTLYDFQIERRDEFLAKVPGSKTVTVREPGIRGEITDRNGIPLARNLRNYEVTFNLEEIRQAYLRQFAEEPVIERVADRSGFKQKIRERDIVSIVKDSTLVTLEQLGLAKDFSARELRTHYLTHGGLIPFSYRDDLTYEQFARFAESNLDLPGVYVGIRPQRQYPYGALASHVIGYLKQWEKGDVPEASARRFDHYIGDDKGIAGVEATMDELLRGPEGRKVLVKDEKGRVISMSDYRDYTKPGVGARVELSLDARLQFLLENTLRRAGRASAVIMDVNTGEVLAISSVPDFDPNHFVPSISPRQWDAYNSDKILAPLTNRAISSFTPGSTYKVPTAIAGCLEGMANRSFSCDGYVAYGKHKVGCWLWNQSKGRHGGLTLSKAIQQSCNPYFNKLSNTIGWKSMVEGFQLSGFGKRTGIELPNESPGTLPGSREWRAAKPDAVMTPALTAMLSIGQGDAMATPLQLCAMTAAVANGGRYFQPRIIRRAISDDGRTLVANTPRLEVDFLKSGVKAADLELIRKGMWMAVNQVGGTGGRAKLPDLEIAAKTGTAQTVDNGKPSNNSWMIAFAPYDQPKYAICILVENAGSGGKVCGPLAQLIFRGILARDEGIKLPLKPQTPAIGNLLRIEEIEPAADLLATIEASGADETGETGDEVAEIVAEIAPAPVIPDAEPTVPEPTITQEVDAEGIIPRALPVPEDD